MAVRAILEYPDARLRTLAQPVVQFDAALAELIGDLVETMHASKAIGLAATQVDVHLQVVVIDPTGDAHTPQVFVNPRIVSRDGLAMVEESCLSVPGLSDSVRRAARVQVRAQDAVGAAFSVTLEGLPAVCLQHEMDHLLGRLFTDHLSIFKRLRIWRRSVN